MAIGRNRDVIVRRDVFFVAIASTMLLFVLAGFAKTFFARAYFGTLDFVLGTPELPIHLRVHGVILVAWFGLFVAQTFLVATGRTRLHRQLGVAGAVLASLVVGSGLITVVKAVSRSAGLPVEALRALVFANSAALAAFSICLLRGLALRSDPSIHKRMMVIASSNICVQAGARVGELFGLSKAAFSLPTLLIFLLAMVVYDLATERRVHTATVWGGCVSIACPVLFVIIGNSSIGDAVVELLR